MLKSCPRFFRGPLRTNVRVALEERHQVEREGNEMAEKRAEALHTGAQNADAQIHGTGSVGRDELAARAELFVQGRWREFQEFHSHWNTKEAVCQERGVTKRHGSPGARAEGTRLFAIDSQKRGDFEGAP